MGDVALPKGWREVRLGEVAEVIVSNVDKKTRDGEHLVRLCNYLDVYRNDVVHPDMSLMPASATTSQLDRFRLRAGDVVVTKDSEDPSDIGVPAFVSKTAADFVCGYHLAIIRPGRNADGLFLKHLLASSRNRAYFASRANGATRFGLTRSTLEAAPVLLPPIREQRRIATILRTWDKAIKKVRALHDAKVGQRHGLAQALITGDLRPTGFEKSEWRRVQMGDVTRLSNERIPMGRLSGSTPCIELEHMESGAGRLLHVPRVDELSSNKSAFHAGDVLFGKLRPYLCKY